MCAAPAPRGPQGPSREPALVTTGDKRRAPAWSGTEVLTLLELWGEEEAVQARRRNASIYGRMAKGLANKGHHPRTLQQVRAKVKELRQGYMKARAQSSASGAAPVHCTYFQELDRILGGQEQMSASVLVQTGLHTPVQHSQQEVPMEDVEEEEEAQDQTEDTLTLSLQPVPDSGEASQAPSDAEEGTSAGPAAAVRRATPVPPPTRSHSTRRHWRTYNDHLRRHVEAMGKNGKDHGQHARDHGRKSKGRGSVAYLPAAGLPPRVEEYVCHRLGVPGCARFSPPGDSSCPSRSSPL